MLIKFHDDDKVAVTDKINDTRYYSSDLIFIVEIAVQNNVGYNIFEWDDFFEYKKNPSNMVDMKEAQEYFKNEKYHDLNEKIIDSFKEHKYIWTSGEYSKKPDFMKNLYAVVKNKNGGILALCGMEAMTFCSMENLLSGAEPRDAIFVIFNNANLMAHAPTMFKALKTIQSQVLQGLMSDETGRTKALLAINAIAKTALNKD